MVTRKSKAVVSVADGAGNMIPVIDRRFEDGEWPIRFSVAAPEADTWLQYLSAACLSAGWSFNSIGQPGAEANSASLTILAGAPERRLAVVWERKRRGSLSVRARSAGEWDFPLAEARQFFDQVNERCKAQLKERVYRRGQLTYRGMPWLGELWMEDSVRLSNPSRQGDLDAAWPPRVILVDADLEGIDFADANEAFHVKLRELAIFVTVTLGHEVQVPAIGDQVWVWARNPAGEIDCDIRSTGYIETEHQSRMPQRGQEKQIMFQEVQRPTLLYTRSIGRTSAKNRQPMSRAFGSN